MRPSLILVILRKKCPYSESSVVILVIWNILNKIDTKLIIIQKIIQNCFKDLVCFNGNSYITCYRRLRNDRNPSFMKELFYWSPNVSPGKDNLQIYSQNTIKTEAKSLTPLGGLEFSSYKKRLFSFQIIVNYVIFHFNN